MRRVVLHASDHLGRPDSREKQCGRQDAESTQPALPPSRRKGQGEGNRDPPLRLPELSRESSRIWGRHQCMGRGLNEFIWL